MAEGRGVQYNTVYSTVLVIFLDVDVPDTDVCVFCQPLLSREPCSLTAQIQ